MKSAIYQGWVRHQRRTPKQHKFSYRVFMLYLCLDELPEIFDGVWGWSARSPALARFLRSDFLGDPRTPLDKAVRERVFEATGEQPKGPIFLLANLRYFGFIMNPISCYYCFAEDGVTLEYLVAEVNNTPWNERHSYVLPVQAGQKWLRQDFDKELHVSPFHPMNMRYHWHSNTPSEKLIVHLGNSSNGEKVFDASMSLTRKPMTPTSLVAILARYPFMTVKICASIYWQALCLWLKRTPFYPHPSTLTVTNNHE